MKPFIASFAGSLLVATFLAVASPAQDDAALKKDLTAVIALHGFPCGEVVAVQVLADNNYDRNDLYERAGRERGVQWVAPPRRNAKGLGHGRHSDWRMAVQPWLRTGRGRLGLMPLD